MAVTNYLWDEDNIALETDEAAATIAEYTYEPEQYGNLISERRGGTTYQHHYDAIGSTRLLTDESGQITDTFDFDAWGIEITRTGTTETPFRWIGEQGYYFDFENGDYYVRARTYSSGVSRWLSVDPDSYQMVYVYVYNAPIELVDPNGHATGLILSPKSAKNAPWCEVKKGEAGETATIKYDVQCVCDCCENEFLSDNKTHKRKIKCTVRAWLQIRINMKEAKKVNPRGAAPGGVKGVYGHEQRHVKNLIKAAKDAQKKLDALIGTRKCIFPKACRILAKKFVIKMTGSPALDQMEGLLTKAERLESTHKPPAPVFGQPYPPFNRLPKSDCKKPGLVPGFPKEKQCKKEDDETC